MRDLDLQLRILKISSSPARSKRYCWTLRAESRRWCRPGRFRGTHGRGAQRGMGKPELPTTGTAVGVASLAAWLARWGSRYPKLCLWVEENIEETLSFYRLPRQHHKHLKSSNLLERLMERIKRRRPCVSYWDRPAWSRRRFQRVWNQAGQTRIRPRRLRAILARRGLCLAAGPRRQKPGAWEFFNGCAQGSRGLVDLVGVEPTTSSMPSFWSQSLTSIDTRNKRLSGT